MNFPFGETFTAIKRVKRAQPDAYGNDVFDDVPQGTFKGAFDPGTSTEQLQGQDMVTAQPRVLAEPGTSLTAIDAVERANGDTYEIDGIPNNWVNPSTGWNPGVEVRLKRVTG